MRNEVLDKISQQYVDDFGNEPFEALLTKPNKNSNPTASINPQHSTLPTTEHETQSQDVQQEEFDHGNPNECFHVELMNSSASGGDCFSDDRDNIHFLTSRPQWTVFGDNINPTVHPVGLLR